MCPSIALGTLPPAMLMICLDITLNIEALKVSTQISTGRNPYCSVGNRALEPD